MFTKFARSVSRCPEDFVHGQKMKIKNTFFLSNEMTHSLTRTPYA